MQFQVDHPLTRDALSALHAARPKQFEVVQRMLERRTQEEIAAELGITQAAVSQRLRHAKRSLQRIVSELRNKT